MRNYIQIIVLLVFFATVRTALADIMHGYNDLEGYAIWIIWPSLAVVMYLVYKLKKKMDFADKYYKSSTELLDKVEQSKNRNDSIL